MIESEKLKDKFKKYQNAMFGLAQIITLFDLAYINILPYKQTKKKINWK